MDPQHREQSDEQTVVEGTNTAVAESVDDPHKTAVLAVVSEPPSTGGVDEKALESSSKAYEEMIANLRKPMFETQTTTKPNHACAVVQLGAICTPADQGKVNVLENGLESRVDGFKTPTFDASIDALKKVVENLSEALKTSTDRDLRARATRLDFSMARVRYEVQLYSDLKDCEIKYKLLFVSIAWRTGEMEIERCGAGLTPRRGEAVKCNGYYGLEKIVGELVNDVEGEVFRLVLGYSVKKEFS